MCTHRDLARCSGVNLEKEAVLGLFVEALFWGCVAHKRHRRSYTLRCIRNSVLFSVLRMRVYYNDMNCDKDGLESNEAVYL